MADTKTTIQQAYSAFNKRDIDGALALMTPDVSWPKASEGGTVVGKEEIRDYWTRQWAEFDPHVEPLALTEVDGGKIHVRVQQLVRSLQGDVLFDGEVVHLFTLKSGRIAAMDLGDDADANAAPSAAFTHHQSKYDPMLKNAASADLENETSAPWLSVHPCSVADVAAMVNMRAMVTPNKGKLQGVEARIPFSSIMERVVAPEGVAYEADQIGGVPGWWCRRADASSDHVIIHIHGGWFNWGTPEAFRHFGGHIATHAGSAVFLPDYRLAPEHPFPAAIEDVRACYFGLVERGHAKIAVTGDSAGGNLALGLLAYLAKNGEAGSSALVGGVAISPVTDLTLSGASWASRAIADPLFVRPQAAGLIEAYLAGHSPKDPGASPLFADLKGLAPILVYVGDDEVLLDDSVRFVRSAVESGVDAHLHVWKGMIHGFLGSVGRLEAPNKALLMLGDFLGNRFGGLKPPG